MPAFFFSCLKDKSIWCFFGFSNTACLLSLLLLSMRRRVKVGGVEIGRLEEVGEMAQQRKKERAALIGV